MLNMILVYYAVRGEKMKVSNQIKKYRKNAEMTQTELAEKLYTTRQTVSKWEQGTIEPNIDMLIQLAQLFDVTVDDLVTGEQSINKSSQTQVTNPTNMWDFLVIYGIFRILISVILRRLCRRSCVVRLLSLFCGMRLSCAKE